MRLIDMNALLKAIPNFDLPGDTVDAETLRIILASLPEVDAVPVVRCKVCKLWGRGVAGETEHVKECAFTKNMISENGFCSLGEKTDE